jgi:hypothetical protein
LRQCGSNSGLGNNGISNQPATANAAYQAVLDEYSDKIAILVDEYNAEAKRSKTIDALMGLVEIYNAELADISGEGISKMMNIGTGEYGIYEEWVEKLVDVYSEAIDKIWDVYVEAIER